MVLGAGLAGLGCARHLPGCRVFEAADHSGGHAYSHELGGTFFDEGAHICHSRDDEFLRLIESAAHDVITIEPSVVRNRWENCWLSYPVQNHLHELPLEMRVAALVDLVEAHVHRPDVQPLDYRSLCLDQYGRFLTENFYDVFTSKYWRVSARELATDWLGGRVLPSMVARIIRGALAPVREEQAVFARFRYPARGGFFRFFAPLYDAVDIHHGHRAVQVDAARKTVRFASGRRESYDFLASSIPLPVLVSIIKDAPGQIRQAAQRLRWTQLICVNMIVNRPRLTDCHWFYIYDRATEAARVSVPSNLAPGSLPNDQTALQAEIFRRHDETFNAAALVEQTVTQLSELLGFDSADVHCVGHVHVPWAYVISDHERARATNLILAWLERHDVFSMGLYGRWKYIWSDEAFRQGQRTAEAILARRGLLQAA
jgi:protoporphyrinogen oxidase